MSFKHFFSLGVFVLALAFGFTTQSVQAQSGPTQSSLTDYAASALGLNIGYSLEGTSETEKPTQSQSTTSQANQSGPITYQNGYYTNLCGTGTAATAHTCNGGCNPATGSCSSNNTGVVKYTCAGKTTECRQNESSFAQSQSLSGASCGQTIQIDVFSKRCRVNGDWVCSDQDLQDYMVWYSGDCETPPPGGDSCSNYEPVNTQFRRSGGNSTWVSGTELTNLTPNSQIDINCFAQNGSSLLPGAQIKVLGPDNQQVVVSNSAEARGVQLNQAGRYRITCESTTIAQCLNTDTVIVQNQMVTPTPQPSPTPHVSPSPSPSPDPVISSCDDLTVAGGNNQEVPAEVTLRARASDNKTGIQRYRFYFGDGEQLESTQPEVQHTYESSGNFVARVDIKDSTGEWKTSNACEANVRVQSSPVESHKADCSDLFMDANNSGKAPSIVTFDINGYDNKGDIQAYKIETGTGHTLEEDDDKMDFLYEEAGTYTVRAYIKDSKGNWRGGDDSCRQILYINTKPLTSQPKTGTPTWFTLSGLLTGIGGIGLQIARRQAFPIA